MPLHKHLRRLARVWIPNAVYFLTICTHDRRAILASSGAVGVMRAEWKEAGTRHGWLIGRYVILPDHVHFFCAESPAGVNKALSRFMSHLKEWTAKGLCTTLSLRAPIWQAGFFDHALRSDESYAEKWMYVRESPVRAGLVSTAEDWPYQGFVDFDHPHGL